MTKKLQIHAAAKTPRVAVAASEFRFEGSSERAVGANGEINASSRREALEKAIQFQLSAAAGSVVSNGEAQRREEVARRNREMLAAAKNDKVAHAVLGQKMADALYITGEREGFSRTLLVKNTVEQGSVPRFEVSMMNTTAVMATGPTQVQSQIVRDKWLTPPEIQLIARPFVPQNELNQSQGDVLGRKFNEGLTSLMVAEDRLLINMANRVVGAENDLTIIAGQLTPYTMMTVANNVTRWGLKGAYLLMASDFMMDIIGNQDFATTLDPVARHETLLTGQLATAYGMAVLSDAYRHQEHKVLNRGEFFVFSDPLNLGAYSDRGGIDSDPISIMEEKVAGRGWIMVESYAAALTGGRAVAKGLRV